MKALHINLTGVVLLIVFTSLFYQGQYHQNLFIDSSEKSLPMNGAWKLVSESQSQSEVPSGATAIMILSDGRFSVAYFDREGKQFLGTYGGTFTITGNRYIESYDFNTWDSTQIGNKATLRHTLTNNNWTLSGKRRGSNVQETWQRIDDASQSSLAGAWQITSRLTGSGEMAIITPGPRKTVKMLSGTRFHWIAFNTETNSLWVQVGEPIQRRMVNIQKRLNSFPEITAG